MDWAAEQALLTGHCVWMGSGKRATRRQRHRHARLLWLVPAAGVAGRIDAIINSHPHACVADFLLPRFDSPGPEIPTRLPCSSDISTRSTLQIPQQLRTHLSPNSNPCSTNYCSGKNPSELNELSHAHGTATLKNKKVQRRRRRPAATRRSTTTATTSSSSRRRTGTGTTRRQRPRWCTTSTTRPRPTPTAAPSCSRNRYGSCTLCRR